MSFLGLCLRLTAITILFGLFALLLTGCHQRMTDKECKEICIDKKASAATTMFTDNELVCSCTWRLNESCEFPQPKE